MGITIHYRLRAWSDDAVGRIVAEVVAFALDNGWPCETSDERDGERIRWDGGEEVTVRGHIRGVRVEPPRDSEGFTLEFGPDLIASNWTKTQYAPFDVHEKVVELLRRIVKYAAEYEILDEAGLWESGDVEQARHAFAKSAAYIEHVRRTLAADGG